MAYDIAQTFAAYRVALNKPFLGAGRANSAGSRWQRALGQAQDETFNRFFQAREARFPSYCASDGLQYIAGERGVERCIGESEADYREVLRNAWNLWARAGTDAVHQFNLARMGCPNVEVVRRADFSDVALDPAPYVTAFARDVWAQFDVIIEKPMPWTLRAWGTGTWGTGVWGSTITTDQIEQIRRLLRTFRAAHDTPTYIWLHFGSGRLWGIGRWGSGVWGGSGEAQRLLCGETHWAQRGLV